MSEDEIGQPRSNPNGPSYHPLSQIKAVERKAVFSCKFCKTKFPLMIQKKAHSIPKKVTCSRCGHESQSKCEFYKHRTEHEKEETLHGSVELSYDSLVQMSSTNLQDISLEPSGHIYMIVSMTEAGGQGKEICSESFILFVSSS